MKRALIVLLLFTSHAYAWEPIYPTRPVWRPPAPYALNRNGSPDLGGFAGSEPIVRMAMDDWTRVSCTSLTTRYNGMSSAVPGSYEGTSVIGWIESGWRHEGSAIGVTGPSWSTYIVEADMELNGVNFTWTTGGGSWSSVNAYSIVLHEGGHYYGLGHSNVGGSAMWPSYSGGVVGLGPDDESGICALYPGGGTDCTTTGCPSGQECVGGVCMRASGDGNVCSPCSDSGDCTNGVCLGYPDGGGYCGQNCGSDADCGGDSCVGTTAGPQCVRFSGGQPTCQGGTGGCSTDSDCPATERCSGGACVPRPTDLGDLGEECNGDASCNSGLCLSGVCSQSCDWLNTGSCPSGFYCDGDVTTSCSEGYCVRGTAGAGELGDSCSGDQECRSLHCDDGVCSQPCIPGGAVGCPAGYACQVGSLPCKGSCRVSGALGDPCAGNDECTSGICAAMGERTFCTAICDDANPCPERFTCQGAGSASVCAPDAGGLGEACEVNGDCLSGICAAEGDETYCTRICNDREPCPAGDYECSPTSTDGVSVCEPTGTTSRGGCGCRAAGGRDPIAPLLGLIALGLFLVRRRR